FTVEAWIKPGPRALTDAEMDVVSHHDPDASQGWSLIVKSGRVEIIVFGTDTVGVKYAYSAGNDGPAYVVAGKWAHVAGTRSGDTLRIYYDGKLRSTQTLGVFFGRDGYVGALRLGRAASSAEFPYEGQLDDLRLSKVARYTGAVAPKPIAVLPVDDSTVAAWRFDEASGAVLVDAAKHNHDGSLAPDATAATRVAAPCVSAR
ncbi:MAG TPA: LamG domain-containing protein, partial [Labilithrix sp.]|nr:LamG domain-containing protein [Labilithrix sp.]